MTIKKKLTNLKFIVCNACMGPAWLLHGEVLNSSSSYATKIRGILYSSLRGVVVTLLHSMNGQMSNCKTAEILRKNGPGIPCSYACVHGVF